MIICSLSLFIIQSHDQHWRGCFVQRRIQGGGGAKPPPLDQWNLLFLGGFQAPMAAEAPPLGGKKCPPWTNSWIRPWYCKRRNFTWLIMDDGLILVVLCRSACRIIYLTYFARCLENKILIFTFQGSPKLNVYFYFFYFETAFDIEYSEFSRNTYSSSIVQYTVYSAVSQGRTRGPGPSYMYPPWNIRTV